MDNKMVILINVSNDIVNIINDIIAVYDKSFLIQIFIEILYEISDGGVELFNGLGFNVEDISDLEYYKADLIRLNIRLFLTLDIIIEREVSKLKINDIYLEGNIIIIRGRYA